jgi:cyclophilin family peptidyl-prolyl cis-trans isomerase
MTKATIQTDKGAIEIDIDEQGAPKAAANFVELAQKGYFDGVIFHRLVPGFVIQGGDGQFGKIDSLDNDRVGTGGPGYRFADEPFSGDYVRGAVAMANAGPNTNGSQFFICLVDLTGRLPRQYTRFGQVTSGMDVVDAIAASKRDSRDRPLEPTAMRSVKIAD